MLYATLSNVWLAKLLILLGFGGAKRDRTADLFNAIEALSQLSYGPSLTVKAWEALASRFTCSHPNRGRTSVENPHKPVRMGTFASNNLRATVPNGFAL